MVNVDNEEQQLNAGLSPYLSYYRRRSVLFNLRRTLLIWPVARPGVRAISGSGGVP